MGKERREGGGREEQRDGRREKRGQGEKGKRGRKEGEREKRKEKKKFKRERDSLHCTKALLLEEPVTTGRYGEGTCPASILTAIPACTRERPADGDVTDATEAVWILDLE